MATDKTDIFLLITRYWPTYVCRMCGTALSAHIGLCEHCRPGATCIQHEDRAPSSVET